MAVSGTLAKSQALYVDYKTRASESGLLLHQEEGGSRKISVVRSELVNRRRAEEGDQRWGEAPTRRDSVFLVADDSPWNRVRLVG